MTIKLEDIFTTGYTEDVVNNSELTEIDTADFGECDVIALVHTGRNVINALPAYFTRRGVEDEIMVEDPRRNLQENAWNAIRVSHIHTIKGVKITCVTLNLPEDIPVFGKYYPKDNWLN